MRFKIYEPLMRFKTYEPLKIQYKRTSQGSQKGTSQGHRKEPLKVTNEPLKVHENEPLKFTNEPLKVHENEHLKVTKSTNS